MKPGLKNYLPLMITVCVVWIMVTLAINSSLKANRGNFVYSLDDTYIHMAMAKNFSQEGVWGVSKNQFTSSSSSLLWTLLLSALFYIGGINPLIPLVVNIFVSTMLVFFIFYILKKFRFSLTQQTLIMVGFVFFTPLLYLILGGLEHVLQIFINLVYLYLAAKVIENLPSPNINTYNKMLYLFSPLVVLARYEGLFIILAVSLLLLLRKKMLNSLLNFLLGMAPILLYGIISVSKGWYFLPTSVYLKGRRPDLTNIYRLVEFVLLGLRQLIYNPHILIILICVLALLWVFYKAKGRIWAWPGITALIFTIVVFIHMFLAETGFFRQRYSLIRYDAYLVAMGIFVIMVMVGSSNSLFSNSKKNPLTEKLIKFGLIIVILLPLAERGIMTDLKVVRATTNIYHQQYQMGVFLNRYYPHQTVVVNDIGVVNFLGEINSIDVWGLVNKEIASLRLKGAYNTGNIKKVVQKSGARIALVYQEFIRMADVEGDLPKEWIKVAQWKIPNNVVCAADTVSLYSLGPTHTRHLIRNFQNFSRRLPAIIRKYGVRIRRFPPENIP